MARQQHNRDMLSKHGFYDESSIQDIRENDGHVKSGYAKAPKAVHQRRCFGGGPGRQDFTPEEMLKTLLEQARSTRSSGDLWVRIGRCYLSLNNPDDARKWLTKAAELNRSDAIELLQTHSLLVKNPSVKTWLNSFPEWRYAR